MNPLVLMSSLAPGGAERVTVSFLCHLARMGSPVPLCTLTARDDDPGMVAELSASGVERLDLGVTRLASPRGFIRLASLVQNRRFDLVHAHGQDASVLAGWVKGTTDFRLVVTRHVLGEPMGTWRERVRAGTTLRVLRNADAVVAVSGVVVLSLRAAGVPDSRLHRIHNGIELDRFGVEPARDVGPGPTVLVPAVLRPGKGHDVLLKAIPEVLSRVPGTRFLLAGDGPLRQELARVAGLNGEAIRLLGHRDDMPALMAAVDLICLPSLSEALPTVLIEAAAAGKAAVSTRVGGIPEVVEDGRTGILVPAGDPGALAQSLIPLLQDSAGRSRMGEAARRRAEEMFSLDTQVERTWALWKGIAGRVAA